MKFSANIQKISLISDKTCLFLVFITYRWYRFNDIKCLFQQLILLQIPVFDVAGIMLSKLLGLSGSAGLHLPSWNTCPNLMCRNLGAMGNHCTSGNDSPFANISLVRYLAYEREDVVFVIMRSAAKWKELLDADVWEKMQSRLIVNKNMSQSLSENNLGKKNFNMLIEYLK